MTKRQLKKLAYLSYTENNLDTKKINQIIKTLSRKELREYIKLLKIIEKEKTVTIITAKLFQDNDFLENVRKIFKDRKILIKEDKNILAGIRIIDNDNVYDYSLSNKIDNIVSYLK